jgi:ABC1 atypical kinase-like domain
MCLYMSKLHSNVKAHKLSATKQIVEHAFDGREFDTIWEEFDEIPLGIGAIAQVGDHRNVTNHRYTKQKSIPHWCLLLSCQVLRPMEVEGRKYHGFANK